MSEEKNKNLAIWDKVKKTDLKWLKQSDIGAKLTSINGMYCVMRATEIFGPCGLGWGYEILEERLDNGVLVKDDTGEYSTKTHTVKIKLWYMIDNKRGEIIHFGHTPYIMKSKYGAYQDEEAPKKSLTDAIKKCLSMIGVGADIHLGQFDDISYKQELIMEAKHEKEIKERERIDSLRQEANALSMDSAILYVNSKNIATLKKVHSDAMASMRRICEKAKQDPSRQIEGLVKMYNEAEANLIKNGEKND